MSAEEKKINIKEYFFKSPLYMDVLEFDLEKVNEKNELYRFCEEEIDGDNINMRCHCCENTSTFSKIVNFNKPTITADRYFIFKIKTEATRNAGLIGLSNTKKYEKEPSSNNAEDTYLGKLNRFYLEQKFECLHCQNTYYISLLFKQKDNIINISKIGQYPSLYEFIKTNEYDKILKKIGKKLTDKENNNAILDDYRYAIICKSNSLEVAAFVHLRRIFENLIIYYEKELEIVYEEKPNMEDRILRINKTNAVNDIFTVAWNNSTYLLYGVLSKGVHMLSTEECGKYTPLMFELINMQLVHEKQKQEKMELERKLNNEIQRLAENLQQK